MSSPEEIEMEFGLTGRTAEALRMIDGMKWFAGVADNAEATQWIIQKQGEALRGLLAVARAMHTEVPGSSWQLHSWMLSEIEKALFGTDGSV